MIYKINLMVTEDTSNRFINGHKSEKTYPAAIYTDRPLADVHDVVSEVRKKMGSSIESVDIVGVDFQHDDYLVKDVNKYS